MAHIRSLPKLAGKACCVGRGRRSGAGRPDARLGLPDGRGGPARRRHSAAARFRLRCDAGLLTVDARALPTPLNLLNLREDTRTQRGQGRTSAGPSKRSLIHRRALFGTVCHFLSMQPNHEPRSRARTPGAAVSRRSQRAQVRRLCPARFRLLLGRRPLAAPRSRRPRGHAGGGPAPARGHDADARDTRLPCETTSCTRSPKPNGARRTGGSARPWPSAAGWLSPPGRRGRRARGGCRRPTAAAPAC